ncbi:hypothetical protein J4E80_006929 [Alternaria sp. BMP 0032]|nr:hypothetical protein J4E80_006929 [Alternaria sp. BMP 0032]
MANLGRNVQTTTNNTPVPHQIGFEDFLSALIALKTEEPSAPQTPAGYQHSILSQFSVPKPTIDQAPVHPTPTNRQFPGDQVKDDGNFRNAAKFVYRVGLQLEAAELDPYADVHPVDDGIRRWLHTYPLVWDLYVAKDLDRRIWLADARLKHLQAQQAATVSGAADRFTGGLYDSRWNLNKSAPSQQHQTQPQILHPQAVQPQNKQPQFPKAQFDLQPEQQHWQQPKQQPQQQPQQQTQQTSQQTGQRQPQRQANQQQPKPAQQSPPRAQKHSNPAGKQTQNQTVVCNTPEEFWKFLDTIDADRPSGQCPFPPRQSTSSDRDGIARAGKYFHLYADECPDIFYDQSAAKESNSCPNCAQPD